MQAIIDGLIEGHTDSIKTAIAILEQVGKDLPTTEKSDRLNKFQMSLYLPQTLADTSPFSVAISVTCESLVPITPSDIEWSKFESANPNIILRDLFHTSTENVDPPKNEIYLDFIWALDDKTIGTLSSSGFDLWQEIQSEPKETQEKLEQLAQELEANAVNQIRRELPPLEPFSITNIEMQGTYHNKNSDWIS